MDLHLDLSGSRVRAGLEGALRDAIRAGRLHPGTRLPSSRALAADLGVARNTVAEVYGQLAAEGWLTARTGSGTSVAPRRAPGPAVSATARPEAAAPRYDLRTGVPDLSAFPHRHSRGPARRARIFRTSTELAVLDRAREHGLALDGLHAFRASQSPADGAARAGLVIGYGRPAEHAYTTALARLCAVLPAGDLLPVPYPRGNGEPGAPVIRTEVVRRLLSTLAAWALAACLLALCGLPLSAGPALAGPVLAGPGRLAPGPGEWWFATWQVQRKVWPLSQGAGITVAEVESGVQASIPDLRGVVRPGINLTSAGLSNGDTDIQVGEDGHGTAMAVMIARQGRGTGTVGIAPQAQILPVTVGGSGPRSVTTAAAGIRYAAAHGAQVIDMPFGIGVTSPSRCDPVLQAAVAYALGRDVVLIASAGNTNLFPGPDEPASCAGVLAVGGTEPDGTLWPASTREPYVAVAAPADHMVYVGRDGRFTTTGAGTSFAAALTAGAAALVRSRYPHMPWYEVDQRLTGTATRAGHQVPDDGYGYGIVNLARAVNASAYPVRASAPDPVLARYRAWLATPAGRTVAARYRLARPGPAVRAASGAPSPDGGLRLRLRLPPGEIMATGTAAACAFVVVLLAVLWMSPQGFIGRSARAARARRRRGTG